jgi:hypothetical protein
MEQAFQFLDAAGGFQAFRQILEFVLLAGKSHGLAQAVGALVSPPFLVFLAQAATRQLPRAQVLQITMARLFCSTGEIPMIWSL